MKKIWKLLLWTMIVNILCQLIVSIAARQDFHDAFIMIFFASSLDYDYNWNFLRTRNFFKLAAAQWKICKPLITSVWRIIFMRKIVQHAKSLDYSYRLYFSTFFFNKMVDPIWDYVPIQDQPMLILCSWGHVVIILHVVTPNRYIFIGSTTLPIKKLQKSIYLLVRKSISKRVD